MQSSFLWLAGVVSAAAFVILLQVALAKSASSSKETRRRWQHSLTGQAMVGISYLLPIQICVGALLLGSIAIYFAHRTKWYEQTFSSILRPNEVKKLPGAFFFLLGTTITAAAFDLHHARYALLCLSCGDPMAAFVGRRYPNSPRFLSANSSMIGSSACFITSFLLGCIMFYGDSRSIWKAIVGGVTCTIAEATPKVDDNLMIPISTAMSIALFEKYLQ